MYAVMVRTMARPVLGLPAWGRAAALLAAWLPFAWVVLIHVPRFAPAFARLYADGGLPDLTRACLWFARLSIDTNGFPVVGLLAALLLFDWLCGQRAQRAGRTGYYWAWFAAVAALAAVATLVVVVALVIPVYRMGSVVK